MKYILLLILFLPTLSIAEKEKEESLSLRDKEWLESYVRKVDYAARLRLISIVILDDITKMKENDYYDYIETYRVLETYKGELPKYILVKSFGEYHKKHNKKRYFLHGEIYTSSLCKGENVFYFPETHVSNPDSDEVINIYKKEAKKKMIKGEKSLCEENDVRGK